jgi:hypothetical protein
MRVQQSENAEVFKSNCPAAIATIRIDNSIPYRRIARASLFNFNNHYRTYRMMKVLAYSTKKCTNSRGERTRLRGCTCVKLKLNTGKALRLAVSSYTLNTVQHHTVKVSSRRRTRTIGMPDLHWIYNYNNNLSQQRHLNDNKNVSNRRKL